MSNASMAAIRDQRVQYSRSTWCGSVFRLIAGLVPPLDGSRTKPIEALRDGGRGYTGRAVTRFMRSLVVGQIAMTMRAPRRSLLLVRSILNRQSQSLGYDGGNVVIARMNLNRLPQ